MPCQPLTLISHSPPSTLSLAQHLLNVTIIIVTMAMKPIAITMENIANYSGGFRGGARGLYPSLKFKGIQKTPCIDIKCINSCIKCHFCTLQMKPSYSF